VEPHAGYDEAHRKAGKTADKAADECCEKKRPENQSIHGAPSRYEATSAWMEDPSDGEAA